MRRNNRQVEKLREQLKELQKPKRDKKGRFAKGHSGNPQGRSKKETVDLKTQKAYIKRKLGRNAEKAIDTLLELAFDETTPKRERKEILFGLMDRGWGKPTQRKEERRTLIVDVEADEDDRIEEI